MYIFWYTIYLISYAYTYTHTLLYTRVLYTYTVAYISVVGWRPRSRSSSTYRRPWPPTRTCVSFILLCINSILLCICAILFVYILSCICEMYTFMYVCLLYYYLYSILNITDYLFILYAILMYILMYMCMICIRQVWRPKNWARWSAKCIA